MKTLNKPAVNAVGVIFVITLLEGFAPSNASASDGGAKTAPSTSPVGSYASVNGLKMYNEIHGKDTSGSPLLILLHGGGSTIETPLKLLNGHMSETTNR